MADEGGGAKSAPETMGRRIASRRVLRGFKQAELAPRVPCGVTWLSELENDRPENPSLAVISAIARELGTTETWLVHGDGGPPWMRGEPAG